MEACVDSIESAINAVRGGAKRLELCSALSEGGLTPSVGLLKLVKSQVAVPVFCMIRPRRGDFLYSDLELKVMERDISSLTGSGADGVVFGCLTPEGEVNVKSCSRLVSAVKSSKPGCHMTFHRAIDMTRDIFKAAEVVRDLGFSRILTSGGKTNALEGKEIIRILIESLKENLIVVPGGGINKSNLADILKHTDAFEFHGSARVKVESAMVYKNEDLHMAAGESGSEFVQYVTSREVVDNLIQIYKDVKLRSF